MEMIYIINIIRNKEVKFDTSSCGLKVTALEIIAGLGKSLRSECLLQCLRQNLSQNPMIPEATKAFNRNWKRFLNIQVLLMDQECVC
jgi:hypothetical protein